MHATDYHDLTQVSQPRLAPDGETIAFVRRTPADDRTYDATIHTVPTDAGEATAFTTDAGTDSHPRFSPAGDRLAFVSTRGADDRPQLWIAPTDGGEARRVTAVPGGIAAPTWHPDGTAIAFLQEARPEEIDAGIDTAMPEGYEDRENDPRVIDDMIYRQESAHRTSRSGTYFEGARTHVYVADLDGGVDRVTPAGDRDHYSPAWGPDGSLYYLAHGPPDDATEYEVVRHGPDADTAEALHTFGTYSAGPWLGVADDGRLAYLTDDPDDHLYAVGDIEVYDPATGGTTRPTAALDDTVARGIDPRWGPDGRALYWVTPEAGTNAVYRAPADASATPELVARGEDVNGLAVRGGRVALTQSEWDHRGDVFAVRDGDLERRTRVNGALLAEREVLEPEEIRFSTADGPEVQGWVLTPPDFDPDAEYPLIVEVHGGPVVMWTRSGTMFHEFQTLAHAGYVVFWSNPRGSTGYGESFTRAYADDWPGPYYEDLMAGVDAVAAREYVDEDNCFITGGSYGGYMTGWVIGQTDRFAAANPQRGVYDLATFYGTSAVAKLLEQRYGALPWETPERFREHSPAAHVEDVDTPTLIMQAEEDVNTPPASSHQYYRYLKKCGVETRLVLYPRDGHELSRSGEPGHVVDRLERLLRWFDGYSDHHDAAPAVERGPYAGLSGGPERPQAPE